MKQYQDVTMTGQVDQYLFGIGQHFEVYERFGAHLTEKDGMEGVCFSVWAPAAKSVSVVGTFNGWREAAGITGGCGGQPLANMCKTCCGRRRMCGNPEGIAGSRDGGAGPFGGQEPLPHGTTRPASVSHAAAPPGMLLPRSSFHGRKPVSYTHLDVYKRQTSTRS